MTIPGFVVSKLIQRAGNVCFTLGLAQSTVRPRDDVGCAGGHAIFPFPASLQDLRLKNMNVLMLHKLDKTLAKGANATNQTKGHTKY